MSNPGQGLTFTAEGAVCISYPLLASNPQALLHSIEKAFGPSSDCLGIILVKDLPPTFAVARERLLKLAYRYTLMPEADRESTHSFGWSHGKEIMNGKPDSLKGSYYANPIIDNPDVEPELRVAYPEYYGVNIWPSKDLQAIEGFEDAFKDLGRFMFKVGCELAVACQPFVSAYLSNSSFSLADIISTSQTIKARLLHYFPLPTGSGRQDDVDNWCGMHCDHGLLTGLCSAMYLHRFPDSIQPSVVLTPPSSSGLYIKTRGGTLTKVSIPPDCLAFQTGEALELVTAGKLRATSHCVRAGQHEGEGEISRETFAVFMGSDVHQQLTEEENFGEFSKRIFDEHYQAVPSSAEDGIHSVL